MRPRAASRSHNDAQGDEIEWEQTQDEGGRCNVTEFDQFGDSREVDHKDTKMGRHAEDGP